MNTDKENQKAGRGTYTPSASNCAVRACKFERAEVRAPLHSCPSVFIRG